MMEIVSVSRDRATIALTMEELGLLLNALWQELGYQAPRNGGLDAELREAYDQLQARLGEAIARMDGPSATS